MNEENEVDVPLLRKTLEWAEAEAAKPWAIREWNQGDWIIPAERVRPGYRDMEAEALNPYATKDTTLCGTAFCFAGHVAALDGYSIYSPEYGTDYALNKAGEFVDVCEYAMNKLGISDEQADDLFEGGNSIETLREVCEQIAGEKL